MISWNAQMRHHRSLERQFFERARGFLRNLLLIGFVVVSARPAFAVAFSSTDVPRPIRDLSTTESAIVVEGMVGTIIDVNVTLTITHTYCANLAVWIEGPSGTRVRLFSDLGGSGDNFADTVLNDQSGGSIEARTPPFTGTSAPQEPLASFNGQDANGAWKLIVQDLAAPDEGMLQSWSVEFQLSPPVSGPTAAEAPAEVSVVRWRSVRSHSGIGPLSIELNSTATGNGVSGPTIETREGGVQRIEVDFSAPVTLSADPLAGVALSGAHTLFSLEPATNIVPAGVEAVGSSTIAIFFPQGLRDCMCYTLTLGDGLLTTPIAGDRDVRIRALTADANEDGQVRREDALFLKTRLSTSVVNAPKYDVNLTGGSVNLGDVIFAAGRYIDAPTRRALCP